MLKIKGIQRVQDQTEHEGAVVPSEVTFYLDLEDEAGNEYLLSTRESTAEAIEELLNEIKENRRSLKTA